MCVYVCLSVCVVVVVGTWTEECESITHKQCRIEQGPPGEKRPGPGLGPALHLPFCPMSLCWKILHLSLAFQTTELHLSLWEVQPTPQCSRHSVSVTVVTDPVPLRSPGVGPCSWPSSVARSVPFPLCCG